MEVRKAKEEIESLEKETRGTGTFLRQDDGNVDGVRPHADQRERCTSLQEKNAGVVIPVLEGVEFELKPFSLFNRPKWFLDGVKTLEGLAETGIRRDFHLIRLNRIEHARKKTTQKVNLFEKVQIPGYQEAILKIKRYLEDEENLSKSSQKIMRTHQEQRRKEEDGI